MATDTLTQRLPTRTNTGTTMQAEPKSSVLDLPDERLHSVLYLVCYLCVLVNGTAGGPTGKDIFELPLFWLKLSCCCSAPSHTAWRLCHVQKQQKPGYLLAGVDLVVGAGFIGMEIYEFHHLIVNGMVRIAAASCQRSLLWSARTVSRHFRSYLDGGADGANRPSRLTSTNRTRIMCLSLFWHFLEWFGSVCSLLFI